MKKFSYVVSDVRGLHARNAVELSKAAGSYQSDIRVGGSNGNADMKNVISLMAIGADKGDTLFFTVEGDDEAEAAVYLEALVKINL